MTPSEQCHAAGLKSLAEVARLIGKPAQTLHNWHRDYPVLFEVVVLGAAAKNAGVKSISIKKTLTIR